MNPMTVDPQAFSAVAWIMENKIKNENGSPIEFYDHSFLVDPFSDNSPRQVIKKCAQIGWSTLAILRSFHLAKYAGANIIHTFPSRNMSKDFVIPKVNPLIENNKVIKDMISVDSINLKKVGQRFIYYRGSYEQTEAISISAHILINDEYDRSNQMVLRTYKSRLDDAKRERPELGWEWQFSNPSIPGYGVDVWWTKSDQKHWFVKCPHCNNEDYMKFPENINFESKMRMCAKCKGNINNEDLIGGRWVAKYPDRDISGYWISQMFVPWISTEKIIEDSEGDKEIFHNFTLGEPYVSKDTSLSREAIIKAISPGSNPQTDVAIGVDNGVVKHYVIGNRFGIFKIGKTDSWKDIEDLRNLYNAIMVIDALPYPNTPSQMAEDYPGNVFIHYYQQDKKNMGIIRWDSMVVKSDRTKMIDSVVAEINSKDLTYNLTTTDLEEYITHCTNIYRIIGRTPQGIMKPEWQTIEGRPDHFFHATVLFRVALEQTLGQGSIVDTQGQGSTIDRHPFVQANSAVPALNLKDVAERANRKKQNWKGV
jgi:hypothetical protein